MLDILLKKASIFVLLCAWALPIFGQLNDMEVTDATTAPYTPENLITNVFLGEGVEVTGFQYDGDPTAIGFFKNGLEEIGIERGIVMTTGRAFSSGNNTGSNGTGGQFASNSASPNIGADADLTQLEPNLPNNDVARYIISFIPTSDTIRFNYTFASEEYPEYACSSFNDVFGFFISGPGISGPFQNNADNIALIPGTNSFVSINNLHPQNGGNCPPINEQFYNDNNGSNNQPVYDGYTDVFTAEAVVIPCEEYTIKLVIADKGDSVFDSGVFLEAKSFGAPSLDVDLVTVSPDGTVVEDCSEGSITIAIPNPAENDYPIDYTILGTAENGIDYQTIPGDLFIPAGESAVNIPIIAFEDGLTEGLETVCIDIQRDVCNRDTFCIYINDNQLVDPDLGPDIMQCQADTVQLDGTLDIELPEPPSFTSVGGATIEPTNTAIYSPITVAGVQPFTLGPGVIQSVCVNINHNWVDDLDLFLVSPGGQFIELSTDNGANGDDYINACFSPNATIPINFPGPFAPAEAAPFTGTWQPEGIWEDLWFDDDSPTNGVWELLIIDDANGFTGQLVDWTITFEPLFQVEYKWTPSEGLSCDDCPNPLASPQETTTYTMTACDTYGCSVSDEITIQVDSSLPAPEVICQTIEVDCITFEWPPVAGANGYEVSVNGGAWMPASGATTHQVCGLSFNQNVFIEVRGLSDCNGFIGTAQCMTPDCDGAAPTIELVEDVTCFGGDDGSLTISAVGPFPPFTYTLNGFTNQTGIFTGLSAGTQEVIILDAGGCAVTVPVEINQPDELELQNAIINHVQCYQANDGSATVVIGGGTGPFNFDWSNGETDSIAVALPPGNAEVLVTDAEGCQSTATITITEPAAFLSSTISSLIQCSGDNSGTATALPNGGAMPYTYLWNDDNAQIEQTATGLLAGEYEVQITDNNGCVITSTVIVEENTPVTSSTTGSDATCNGTPDGMATVTASGGGNSFYFYEWDENAGGQMTSTATDLDVGWYYVTISDLFNCTTIDSVEITTPDAMIVDYMATPTFCPESVDGQATVTVEGGTMPYTYEWADNGANTPDRFDLPSGVTIVTITDANDCFVELEVDVPAPTAIEAELTVMDALCEGSATGGMICAILPNSGGAEPYTFNWDNGATSAEITGLAFGFMCVTITDNNGCILTLCDEVQAPPSVEITVETTTNVSCFEGIDGLIDISVNGGTPDADGNYTFNWSNNTNEEDATNLTAGTYTVEVIDINGCTATQTFTIDEPTALTASTAFTPSSCDGSADGTATVSVEGGTEPYEYDWDTGNNTDEETVTGLLDGTVNVIVTDANGCIIEAAATLPTPELIIIESISGTDVNCNDGNDGTASVVANGGTGTLYYDWSNGGTDATINTLTAGTYTVIITDDAGCESSESITIAQPEALNASLNQTASFCHDGSDGTASVSAINYGNTPADLADFTYAWSSAPAQITSTANGLIGGQTYTVTITDATGCSIMETITIDNPAEIAASIANPENASCFEARDGSATALAEGGTAPYDYLWDANALSQNTATAIELGAGTYEVTITDVNGCFTTTNVQITEPSLLELQFEADNTSCGGALDGRAEALGNGGTMPYSYAWPNGETTAEALNLAAASYLVTLTDANGCEVIEEVVVEQPEPVVTEIIRIEDVSCEGLQDGLIELSSTGGTYPYRYSLDGQNYLGTSTLIALEAGDYDIFIQDANGCEFFLSDIVIDEPNPIEVDLGADINVNYGEELILDAAVSGANGNVTYNWRPIGANEFSCYDCPNPTVLDLNYQLSVELTVTDENGCTDRDILLIQVNKERNVVVPTGFAPNESGATENNALHVHGGTGTKVTMFRVFDRWGDVLYEAEDFMVNDLSIGWDGTFRGKDMPNGVYVWYVEVEYEDGETGTFKGNTTLVR